MTSIEKLKLKLNLLISLILSIVPILLPIISGELLNSVSHYAYSKAWWVYNILLYTISILLTIDGVINKRRRLNIYLGGLMLGVVLFPVEDYRYLHDIFAILFFLLNLIVLTYSKNLTMRSKILLLSIIKVVLILLFTNLITLFIAESIGLFMLSMIYLRRFLLVL